MKKLIAIIFFTLLLASCASDNDTPEMPEPSAPREAPNNGKLPPAEGNPIMIEEEMPNSNDDPSTFSTDLVFIPDEGFRLDYGAQVHVIIDEETGDYYAVHKDTREGNEGGQFIGSNLMHVSTNGGLTFDEGEPYQRRTHSTDWGLLMPEPDENGKYFWRRYILTSDGMESEITYDGDEYEKEEEYRYELQEDDGQIGYYDLFVNNHGEVILLYIANMVTDEEHTVLAVSTDNGVTFELVDENPLNDQGTGSKGLNQRDPRFTVLDDGTAKLFTMVQGPSPPIPGTRASGYIYSFTTEDGHDYELDPGIRLQTSDFTEFDVWSLNDPHTLLLPDGRFRIYVTGLIADESGNSETGYKEVILSATTAE
jgi:hypothetical protein